MNNAIIEKCFKLFYMDILQNLLLKTSDSGNSESLLEGLVVVCWELAG